jgi:hypothetical protein
MQCEERPAAPSPQGEGAANESVGLLCLDAPFKLLCPFSPWSQGPAARVHRERGSSPGLREGGSEVSYYRWRKEHGGSSISQADHLKRARA